MLFDNGIFWLIIIILTVAGSVLIGIYNREEDKDNNFLIMGWVVIGIDLLIFTYALFQAFTLKSASKNLLADIKQNY
jgi:hypothetical protein